jgi:hypothetical protein
VSYNGLKNILTSNRGSASVKFSLYRLGPGENLALTGKLDRIGLAGGEFRARDGRHAGGPEPARDPRLIGGVLSCNDCCS